jgi:hypothetical protein
MAQFAQLFSLEHTACAFVLDNRMHRRPEARTTIASARRTPNDEENSMIHRLIVNWVYGGFLAGLLLLLISPLIVRNWPPALAAAFFCLPAYMLHQYEEHDDGRFRIMINRMLAGGRDALTVPAVFIINVPGVWGVIALSLWLAAFVHPGLALIAVYLPLVNAVIHIAPAVATRSYNPGLITAVVLFLPLCVWCLLVIQRSGAGGFVFHAIGLGSAFAIHAAVIFAVLRNRRKLSQTPIIRTT